MFCGLQHVEWIFLGPSALNSLCCPHFSQIERQNYPSFRIKGIFINGIWTIFSVQVPKIMLCDRSGLIVRKAESFCILESLPGCVEQRQEQVKRERQSLQCKINDLIQMWGRSREILHKAMVKKQSQRDASLQKSLFCRAGL